mmetsp:Transcript_79096/g.180996  ORF Transcript_79096/g.180996 Transcript_79096/m.180996 type:complete len:160 (-) Transcript_79096:177-656(-)
MSACLLAWVYDALVSIQDLAKLKGDMPMCELKKRVMAAIREGGCTVEEKGTCLRVSWPRKSADPGRAAAGNVRGKCTVCHSESFLVALVPCGHTVCLGCSKAVARHACPCCRGTVTRCIPMFVDRSGDDKDEVESEKPSKIPRTESLEVLPLRLEDRAA